MKFNNAPMMGPQATVRLPTARNMIRMWATFARTERAGAEGQPDWEPCTLANRKTIISDAQCRMQTDPERFERDLYNAERGATSMGAA